MVLFQRFHSLTLNQNLSFESSLFWVQTHGLLVNRLNLATSNPYTYSTEGRTRFLIFSILGMTKIRNRVELLISQQQPYPIEIKYTFFFSCSSLFLHLKTWFLAFQGLNWCSGMLIETRKIRYQYSLDFPLINNFQYDHIVNHILLSMLFIFFIFVIGNITSSSYILVNLLIQFSLLIYIYIFLIECINLQCEIY